MNSINQLIGRFGQLGVNNNIASQPIKTSLNKQEYNERHFRQRYIDVIQKIANEWSKQSMPIEDRYYKIQFSEPDFKLKDINSRYFNERVTYFTREGLEDRQVFAINGLLINSDLKKYNTTERLDATSGDGEMIVMDRLGSLFIAPKERGVFHHSSFFSGKPVAYAALCEIKEGKIINKVRYSGHYTPGPSEESSFEIQLKTFYLKLEPIFPSLKLDKEGNLVQAISISSKQKAEELYDIIAKIGGFARSRLQLMCNGLIQPSEVIGETKLKSGCRIQALESCLTRYDRIYPQGLFELTINEPVDDIKLSENNQGVLKLDVDWIPANFIHESGDWSLLHSGACLCRNISFRSTTADSIITSFSILGYGDDTTAVFLNFNMESKDIARHLRSFNIRTELYEVSAGFLKTKTKEDAENVFSMLCNYNEMPKDKIGMCKTALQLDTKAP